MLQTQTTPDLPGPWTRRLLSTTTIVILILITWCNLPDDVPRSLFQAADRNLSAENAWRVRMAEWYVRMTAHVAGFNSKWQMYGGQSRFNWKYTIKAHYGDEKHPVEVVLPLPRQSERTWTQATLLDFKEAKFLLNIYNDRLARETYARYLARQFPEHDGQPVHHISYTLSVQYILPPVVAVRQQQLLEPDVQSEVIDMFDVRAEQSRLTGRVAGLF
ncbi:MAG: hypothetical protein KDA96_05985 [Planctomycetaceae bacterium]|nr:hypothetical protein [Planctomycetaceae bacterium]